MSARPHVLVVAGSDSSGGAGVARDLETIAALGLRSSIAITAVTAQTHNSVSHIMPLQPDLVAAQMKAALRANPVKAVKIGMLGNAAIAEAVADVLSRHPHIPSVLDPVLAASSGSPLLPDAAIASVKNMLTPFCRLVTPNLPELAVLTGSSRACTEKEMLRQAEALFSWGAQAVLVKGGHARKEHCDDYLILPDRSLLRFRAPRLSGSARGTGCMLASAIAAHLARSTQLQESVQRAKAYVFEQILRSNTGETI